MAENWYVTHPNARRSFQGTPDAGAEHIAVEELAMHTCARSTDRRHVMP